jgi:predicted metalloprotease with PDZ domain
LIRISLLVPLVALVGGAGCASLVPEKLPDDPPPLADMKEPLALLQEPDDESERAALPRGSFSGITVARGWTSLDDAGDEPGLLVKDVVENSPADAAGVVRGDILLAATAVGDHAGASDEVELTWPSQWRKLELETPPGTALTVVFDRAGAEGEATMTLAPRVRAPDRKEAQRYREEERVGVVLRTATEVEARAVGLGPGGGAVVVGLSRRSPWRIAGIRFGDLVVAVAGRPVDHPQVILDAIRDAKKKLKVTCLRKGRRRTVKTLLTERKGEVTRLNIPPLFDYESDRGETEWSVLLGLLRRESTKAAYEWRFLWIFRVRGGDADRLVEVDEK